MAGKSWDRVPIDAQSVDAPLSLAAVFLVVTVGDQPTALAKETNGLIPISGFAFNSAIKIVMIHRTVSRSRPLAQIVLQLKQG